MRWLYKLLKSYYEQPIVQAYDTQADHVRQHNDHIVDGVVRLIQFDAGAWKEPSRTYRSEHQLYHPAGIYIAAENFGSSGWKTLKLYLENIPQVRLDPKDILDRGESKWELELTPGQTGRIHQAWLRWSADRALSQTKVLNKAFDDAIAGVEWKGEQFPIPKAEALPTAKPRAKPRSSKAIKITADKIHG